MELWPEDCLIDVGHGLLREINKARGSDSSFDTFTDKLQLLLKESEHAPEWNARRVVDSLALALEGSLLLRHGNPAVAEAFIRSRLAVTPGYHYGTLPSGVDFRTIIERSTPKV